MANGEFTDKVKILIKAGDGGDGMNSFKAYKGKPACGPDGGDGGRGGDVYFVGDKDMNDLFSFRFTWKYFADNGEHGGTNQCFGKGGKNVYIKVPLGTLVRDADTGLLICDVFEDGREILVARGGNGGKGNVRFTTARRHAPNFAQKGERVKEHYVILEMKVIADVGLVGFPNVGKSTLLSVVSKAHPKIANYHFTTLYPNLGVVYVDEGVSFVMADIPGIIEGASEGAGLGHDFLRHIDRCRLLVHLVDVSGSEGRDPIEDFEAINDELRQYSPDLAARPQIVVANKTDLLYDTAQLDAFRAYVEEKGYAFFAMSAATHQGTRELVRAIAAQLSELPPVTVYESEYVQRPPEVDMSEPLEIRHEDGLWLVEGPWLQRLMANINFSDYESRMYFDKQLRASGLFDQLEAMGIQDGDTVSLYDLEFEYQR